MKGDRKQRWESRRESKRKSEGDRCRKSLRHG